MFNLYDGAPTRGVGTTFKASYSLEPISASSEFWGTVILFNVGTLEGTTTVRWIAKDSSGNEQVLRTNSVTIGAWRTRRLRSRIPIKWNLSNWRDIFVDWSATSCYTDDGDRIFVGAVFAQKTMPMPTPPIPTGDGDVLEFVVIDWATQAEVATITESGDVLYDPSTLDPSKCNLVANVRDPTQVGSVIFRLNTGYNRTESFVPYALFGDTHGSFFSGDLDPANVPYYQVTAVPRAKPEGKGALAGAPKTVRFVLKATR